MEKYIQIVGKNGQYNTLIFILIKWDIEMLTIFSEIFWNRFLKKLFTLSFDPIKLMLWLKNVEVINEIWDM